MRELGVITYRTLEGLVEREIPVIGVYQDPSSHCGFRLSPVSARGNRSGNSNYAEEIERIKQVVPKALHRLVVDFSPLFKQNPHEFFLRVGSLLSLGTFFESKSFFDSR